MDTKDSQTSFKILPRSLCGLGKGDGKRERKLTRFTNGQNNVPLHDQRERIRAHALHARVHIPKSCHLKDRRDRERSNFTIKVDDGLVARALGSKGLIVHDAHAF